MGDINFVNNGKKDIPENIPNEGGNRNIQWSSTNAPDRDKVLLNEKSAQIHSQIPAGSSEKEDMEKIKQSRQEVLEMIKKEKKEGKSDNAKSFFSRFSGALKQKKQNPNEKIAEYHEEKTAESQKRKIEGKEESPNIRPKGFENGSAKIIETNLVNREEDIEFDWSKFYVFLLSGIFLSITVVGLIYVWILGEGEKLMATIEPIKTKIEKNSATMAKLLENSKEVNVFNEKLTLAKHVLDNHVYWTNFFDVLEKNTLSDVNYTGGFSGDIGGELDLRANSESFNNVTNQLRAMQKEGEFIKEVFAGEATYSFSGTASSTPEVSFPIKLVFDKSVFHKKFEDVSLKEEVFYEYEY
jgi:hypothetical protein